MPSLITQPGRELERFQVRAELIMSGGLAGLATAPKVTNNRDYHGVQVDFVRVGYLQVGGPQR